LRKYVERGLASPRRAAADHLDLEIARVAGWNDLTVDLVAR